ncbi:hypothetical protein ALC53_10717 [Atta colombica]|uniref:Uncharacterized protein n=1 Tax=Atta colombica TaxID=520822 RepID=A0A151HZX0_9HYME|nr:hypothetical protein ALC53_10717 [Atta colombica]
MARKTGGLFASKQHRYNVPTCFHTPFITLFIHEQVSFVTAARALQATGKNWSAKRVMERDCLYTRKSEKGIVKCDRKATTAVWEVKRTDRTKTSGIREGDGTDKANSEYFAPRRDTWRRPCLGRDKPLATAAPIEGVKGGGGGWTSVWVSGEQGRAAACCPHQAPLRIFHREFTSLDTTGKLQEWRSNLSLLASVGSLFFSQVPFPERPSSNGLYKSYKVNSGRDATYGREEKYQVKKTDECHSANCKKTQGGSYIAVVINQYGLCKDERMKGEKGCVISRMMVEVSMKEGGRLVSPKSLSLTNSRMSYEQAMANSK